MASGMDLNGTRSILEIITFFQCFAGQFAFFADENQPGIQTVGKRCPQKKPSGFNHGDAVDFQVFILFNELIDSGFQPFRIMQQCCDITELDAFFGIVGNGADVIGQ